MAPWFPGQTFHTPQQYAGQQAPLPPSSMGAEGGIPYSAAYVNIPRVSVPLVPLQFLVQPSAVAVPFMRGATPEQHQVPCECRAICISTLAFILLAEVASCWQHSLHSSMLYFCSSAKEWERLRQRPSRVRQN